MGCGSWVVSVRHCTPLCCKLILIYENNKLLPSPLQCSPTALSKIGWLPISFYGHGQDKNPWDLSKRVGSNPASWFLSGRESPQKVSRPSTHKPTKLHPRWMWTPDFNLCCQSIPVRHLAVITLNWECGQSSIQVLGWQSSRVRTAYRLLDKQSYYLLGIVAKILGWMFHPILYTLETIHWKNSWISSNRPWSIFHVLFTHLGLGSLLWKWPSSARPQSSGVWTPHVVKQSSVIFSVLGILTTVFFFSISHFYKIFMWS